MSTERFQPDNPREWLVRAKSDLAIASTRIEGAIFEDLCFHAQQAVEKSLKALLIHLKIPFPYVHNLAELVSRIEKAGQFIPSFVCESIRLTDYAVEARYPGVGEIVTEEEWQWALKLAREVVLWVEPLISTET